MILVLGSGDVASAVAHALFVAGLAVALQDDPLPAATRRGMAFTDAIFDGTAELDGVTARRVPCRELAADASFIPVLAGCAEDLLAGFAWDAVVDARMRKRSIPPDRRGSAPLVIGLGPNFIAGGNCDVPGGNCDVPGANCDVAVETSRENLGAIVRDGATLPLRGEPSEIAGIARDRYVYAPVSGTVATGFAIGADVHAGAVVATIDGIAVAAPIAGRIRGLVRAGVPVRAGMKVLEVDPRGGGATVFGIDQRPRAIADAVLRVIRGGATPCATAALGG